MKRFVDLRGQATGNRFAWWCTCKDRFETHGGEMAWTTWAEFAEAFEIEEAKDGVRKNGGGLERYDGLCPDWARVTPDDDEDF